jgi:hypothetical protein
MPLKLHIVASRNSADYQGGSRAVSVNLEMECDVGLVEQPNDLQGQIRRLLEMARSSLGEEASPALPLPVEPPGSSSPSQGARNGNASRPATSPQIKDIYAICRQQGRNVRELLREHGGVYWPDDLTLAQASAVIDLLRAAEGPRAA